DRAHVDDGARTADPITLGDLLDELPRHCLGAEETAFQIGANDAVELGLFKVEERLVVEDRRVVDQHIDALVAGERRCDEVMNIKALGDVTLMEKRLAA